MRITTPTFAVLLLALCVSSGLAAQQAKTVLDVQAVVNGILTGADATTHPHLDHNQDGLVNVVDVQHVVGEILNPPPPALTFHPATFTIPVSQFFGFGFWATGGAGAPYNFTHVGGAVPPGMLMGMMIQSSPPLPDLYELQIRGTPTVVGVYNMLVELEDSAGDKFVGTITINVVP
jgi:hypothetical protein